MAQAPYSAPESHLAGPDLRRNYLLAALPREERRRLEGLVTLRSYERKAIVYEQGSPIEDVCFPISGVFSLVTILSDGSGVELATVGREGMVGVPAFLQSGAATNGRAITQVSGEAFCMSADLFARECERSERLHELMHRYTQALLAQIGQSVACNRLHDIRRRAARWLLQSHDRVQSDRFNLTHEFLAEMLGVRRASVTEAAGALQRMGLIRYRRGTIDILDRTGLEAASCECYATVRREFERLLPTTPALDSVEPV